MTKKINYDEMKQPPKTHIYRGKKYRLYGESGDPYLNKHEASTFVDTMRKYKYMNAFKIKTDKGYLVYYRNKS